MPFMNPGCTITAVFSTATIAAVHHSRYHYYDSEDASPQWLCSALSIVFSVIASASLFLLSILDTIRTHDVHQFLLMTTLGSLGFTAISVSVVWFDQARTPSAFPNIRKWSAILLTVSYGNKLIHALFRCIVNLALTILDVILGLVFIHFLSNGEMVIAGIFEWVLTYVGVLWLLSFVGFLL